ncbi:MAG: hypothetical protein IMW93_06005, partial [Thermoanaerobacteraceae bacterium]|nr:hypothetical protein [Thermoanaerobacteraceae bacterium]
ALFYAPFGRSGNTEAETLKEALEDLRMVAEGIQFMMTNSGFGARTSSGFGVAEKGIREGKYQIKGRKPAKFTTLSELVENARKQFEVEKNV